MDENTISPLDLNTADPTELRTIPGVGPAVAKKIVAARPFSSLDDLFKIKGIDAGLVKRITPHFKEIDTAVEPAPVVDPLPDEPAPAAPPAEEDDTLKEKVQEFFSSQPEKLEAFLAGQQPRLEKVKASTGMSNANLMTLLSACLATMVLTILLTFALFGMINGGLRYPAQSEFASLSRQVEASASKLEMLEKDTDSIRARLDALESLSGRMKLIEEENTAIRKQLDDSNRQVAEVRAQMDQTQAKIDVLQKSSDFFNRIFAGLRSLLNETPQP
jgi:hypothetical protein